MTLQAAEIRRNFFGVGNDIELSEVSNPLVQASESELSYLADHPDAWVVLPRKSGQATGWYGLASSPESERQMREVLRAFIGPSFGLLGESRRGLREDDPLERALAESGTKYVALVRPLDSSDELQSAVLGLVQTRRLAPEFTEQLSRPLGLIIRDFHLALGLSDDVESDRLLTELSESAQIRSENIRYLTFERLSALGRWQELASHPWFDTIAATRRPRRTSEVMLEAIWEAYLGPSAADISQLGQRFESLNLGDRYRAVINSIETTTNVGARRLLVLSSAIDGDGPRVQRLLAGVDPTEHLVLQAITSLVVPSADRFSDTRGELPAAFEDGRFERVLQLAGEMDVGREVCEIALRSAEALGDPDSARQAFEILDRAESGVLQTVESDQVFGPLIDRLRYRSELGCSGWPEWFRRLAEGSWPSASEAANLGWDRWPREFLSDSAQIEAVAEFLISAAQVQSREVVHTVIGQVSRLLSEEGDRVASPSLRVAALMVLSEETDASAPVRNALVDMLALILDSNPSALEYDDVIDAVQSHWNGVRAFEAYDWLLDCADLLAFHHSPNPGARTEFLGSVVRDGARFDHRVERHQAALLVGLLEECDAQFLSDGQRWLVLKEQPGDNDPWALLTNKVVGLYSLLDKAAHNFKTKVRELNAQALVELNSDSHGTERLRSLARRADFLVVDTHHAQHSATSAIDEVRPRGDQVFPRGKGVASFLAALRNALDA